MGRFQKTTIKDFPPELLTEIILLVIDDISSYWPQIRRVVLLSAVCAKWRKAIIGMPLIWTRIMIPDHPFELVSLMLERSKPCPLKLWVSSEETFDDRALSLAVDHAERWQEADFHIPSSYYDRLVSIKGSLPLLRRLSYRGSNTPPATFSGFKLAPSLKDLQLAFFGGGLLADLPIAYTQLTCLDITVSDPSDLLSVLAQTSNLIQLDITRTSLGDGTELNQKLCLPVTLPHLRRLCIGLANSYFGSPGHPGDILRFITTPALSDLYVRDGNDCVQCTKDLIIRSACSLKSFDLWHGVCDPDLVPLIVKMPRLEHFMLHIPNMDASRFHKIMSPGEELFPILREMNLTWEEKPGSGWYRLIAHAA